MWQFSPDAILRFVLAELLVGGGILLALALAVFHRGLRRYESGNAIQVQM